MPRKTLPAPPATQPAPTPSPVAAPAPAQKAKAASPAKPAKADTPAKTEKPAKAAKPAKAPKPEKAEKSEKADEKMVRDSFTMPQADFALIAELKLRAATAGRPVKKSELLRAGLRLLAAQTPKALSATLGRLAPVKLGRPRQQG